MRYFSFQRSSMVSSHVLEPTRTCSFLDLPKEIRLRIFECVFSPDNELSKVDLALISRPDGTRYCLESQVLRVCRSFYQEGCIIFYQSLKFSLNLRNTRFPRWVTNNLLLLSSSLRHLIISGIHAIQFYEATVSSTSFWITLEQCSALQRLDFEDFHWLEAFPIQMGLLVIASAVLARSCVRSPSVSFHVEGHADIDLSNQSSSCRKSSVSKDVHETTTGARDHKTSESEKISLPGALTAVISLPPNLQTVRIHRSWSLTLQQHLFVEQLEFESLKLAKTLHRDPLGSVMSIQYTWAACSWSQKDRDFREGFHAGVEGPKSNRCVG